MYVCVYVYKHIYMYIRTNTHINTHTCEYTHYTDTGSTQDICRSAMCFRLSKEPYRQPKEPYKTLQRAQ